MGPKFWAQDAIAVMDAVGCETAAVFAPSFHAMNGLVLAADYPERVRSKSELTGMAVHIGAQVAALAGPGEVLVSSTVRDIVTGSRRTFVERGDYELKGVPDRWRLYALVRERATTTQ